MDTTKIRGCGEVRVDLGLLYYPLGDYYYATNFGGSRGISLAKPIYEEQDENAKKKKFKPRIKYWILPINEVVSFIFEDAPIGKDMPYKNMITKEMADEWISMKKRIDIDEVYKDVKNVLKKCYDFADERDLDIAVLFILQSWFCDVLNAVFYVDVRSQMGGGKTILLELMQGLSRYGVLANDMSFAVIPRIVDRYKCSLFFDEIDMINKHSIEDVFKILRTGYRKGQKYIRAKPKTFEPESFDCYSSKAFNYRSDIADDLKNRSLPINTSKSNDKALPILNLYKEKILQPIAFKIFCLYMDSLPRLEKINMIFHEQMQLAVNKDLVNEVKEVNELIVNINTDKLSIPSIRLSFLSNILRFYHFSLTSLTGTPNNSMKAGHPLSNMDDKEMMEYYMKMFDKLAGRSIEIFSMVIHLCAVLGLDISNNFKEILEEKAEFEDHDEEDLKNVLRLVLIEQEVGAGTHNGLKFRYYRDIQTEFMKKVHESFGFKPDTRSLKKFLRELGFVDKNNKKVIKVNNNQDTALCLLYDDSIKKNLGLP